MKQWTPQQVAEAAGARLVTAAATDSGPAGAAVDSRVVAAGSLFVGLPGATADGGRFAPAALARGAWGVLVSPDNAAAAGTGNGAVLATERPLRSLQRLATAWRRELGAGGAQVIGVTGSTGKTSTKDLLLALLAPQRRTVASRANFNTEIGLPLEIVNAPLQTEVLVLEMGMRGPGQIAELAQIAEPDVGVIVSIGPVHLELLGSIEAIAAAKAELIAGLPPGGTAIIPAGEKLLAPHLRSDVTTVTFGSGGDVRFVSQTEHQVEVDAGGERISLEVPFTQAHLRSNLLAAVAAARAVGVTPEGRVELNLSAGRGQRTTLPSGLIVIDDCYNANPMSMVAALDDLKATSGATGAARRLAVLGDMLELGRSERDFHVALGERAAAAGVDVLITVGPLAASIAERFEGETHSVADAGEAAALVPALVRPGDIVLVKGSRGVGLELVCTALGARDDA